MQLNLFGWEVSVKKARRYWGHRVEELLEKYDHTCHWCRKRVNRQVLWIEHLIPVSQGGADEWDNLRVAHWWCNMARGNLMPDDPRIPLLIAEVSAKAEEDIAARRCVKCHMDISHRGLRAILCEACLRENYYAYRQGWRERNRQRVRDQNNARYARDPIYRAKVIARAKARQRNNRKNTS